MRILQNLKKMKIKNSIIILDQDILVLSVHLKKIKKLKNIKMKQINKESKRNSKKLDKKQE